MSEGLLTEMEVQSYLDVDAREIDRLKKRGKLTAYNLGGTYLRYRKEEVLALRNGQKFRMPDQFERNWWDIVRDFFRFYGAYIFLAVIVLAFIVYFLQP